MAFASNPHTLEPNEENLRDTTVMFPSLHDEVENVLSDSIVPKPWFNHAGENQQAIDEYSTNIMGRFECRNRACPQKGWGSKMIGIVIHRFPNNGYNAVVFKQRCKSCTKLGTLRLNEKSYVERVTYRLRKWAGIRMERPEYNGDNGGPEHENLLCEGCKRGYCQRG
jgi:hypothetical protein